MKIGYLPSNRDRSLATIAKISNHKFFCASLMGFFIRKRGDTQEHRSITERTKGSQLKTLYGARRLITNDP